MDYRKTGDAYMVRVDRGEEVIESITSICKKENIRLGSISGLGAAGKVKLGLFKTKDKKFVSTDFEGDYEMSSIIGNITVMNDEPYLHVHATIADEKQNVFGGHLSSAVISATAELFITPYNSSARREFSEEIGLNLLKF